MKKWFFAIMVLIWLGLGVVASVINSESEATPGEGETPVSEVRH